MQIKIFGKPGCSACAQMHDKMLRAVEKWEMTGTIAVNYIDTGTEDGLVESAFNDISQIPTVLLEKDGRTIARFDGGVKDSRDLREIVNGNAD